MKRIYDFERQAPPVLTEAALLAEQERRAARRRTVLLGLSGMLFQLAAPALAILLADTHAIVSLACVCHMIVSAAGGGTIAVIFAQKEGLRYECR